MTASVNPPRGMRDFLPAEKARRERVLGIIRNTYRAHGFDEIETPVVEDSDRLHAGLGGDNEKLAFAVMRRGLTMEDLGAATDPLALADLGLRFDLTVPLARFYASHRSELPTVFRSLQLGPVWRAERPQKGRYRQFVQCDIDIIGQPGIIAEVELITATAAVLDALGLTGCSIRVNDRRLLTGTLRLLGFPDREHPSVLVTIDKLDKIGPIGVVAELRDRGFPVEPVEALEAFLRRPTPPDGLAFGEETMRRMLPEGVDPVAIAELAEIGLAVESARDAAQEAPFDPEGTWASTLARDRPLIQFDPWLVRGMGYYTGAIFEIAHPQLTYSLGGGGRYDTMIGTFLGTPVPATGFSLGFERIVDLVALADGAQDAVVLVHDPDVAPAVVVALQTALIAQGRRVRLEQRPRNLGPFFAQLAASGFTEFAFVHADSTRDSLDFKPVEADTSPQ